MSTIAPIGSYTISTGEKRSPIFLLPKMVSSVTAIQIELIGFRIGDCIGNNLGIVPKARIDQIVRDLRNTALTFPEKLLLMVQKEGVETALENGSGNLLTQEKHQQFVMNMGFNLKKAITESFSIPVKFVIEGIKFRLSTYDPEEILAETAKNVGVEILPIHVPERYSIELKVDAALSQQQQTLVFSLIEKSRDIEFNRANFTVAQLEEDFYKQ